MALIFSSPRTKVRAISVERLAVRILEFKYNPPSKYVLALVISDRLLVVSFANAREAARFADAEMFILSID